MNLTLLQLILISSAIVLLYIIIDAWKRNKLRIFHALVFIWWINSIILATIYPNILDLLGHTVGVEKWSDFLVYISIIFLVFVFFSLLQNLINQQQEITRLCTGQALREYKLHNIWIPTTKSQNIKDKYVFLIRAYNEASILATVVEEIIDAWFSKIIIINDGSKDNTEIVIDNLSKRYQKNAIIIWLHHCINRGPWAANKTLFAFISQYGTSLDCERCITYDADGQMSIDDMHTFMKYADINKYDIVIGSRFVKGASTENMPWMRKIILRWARVITYIFNGLRVTDVPTWYRMYHITAISKITIISDWFSYQNDIIESIRHHHLNFIEIPVHIKYTDYSLQKWQTNLSSLKILIRLIYSSLFHR
jgi:polyprenyl-phospho-N-acetylgalactosaminyl synthase